MQVEGFFRSLFDYSFGSFVTPRIIKVLYVLATILISLWTLLIILAAFNVSSGAGVLTLIVVAPLLFLVSMIYARVVLELVIVFFRINGNVQEIRDERIGGSVQPVPTPDQPLEGAAVVVPEATSLQIGEDSAVTATAIERGPEAASLADTSPTPEPDPPSPAVRYCENCGAERRPGGRFCTSCGQA